MKPNRYQALATFAAAFAIGGQLPAAPVPFDGGVTRVAPGIENKRFETVNGVLPVSWDPKASPYVELAFNRTTALPSFTHATVKMIFKAPAGTPVGRMGLRLLDAKGETFQYSIPVRQAADGTIEAVWQIAPDTEFISWGNNADKKLDQPVRINAVSFDYDRNAAPSEITLSSIEAETENAPAAGLAVALNAGIKKYVPGGGAPANYAYAAGKGVEVNWEPAKSKYIELVFNRPLQLPEFSKVSVTARIEAPAGCPVRSIGLRMTDKSNETFQFSKSVNFAQGGVSEVTWEVSAGQWQNSWGGNNDKQLDQPMKVYGFGVDYSQNLPEASFRILSVTAAVSGGEKTVATRPLYAFNLSNSFNRIWGSGQPSLGRAGSS